MPIAPAPAATTANTGPTLPAQTLSKGGVTATPGFNTTPANVAAAKAAGFTTTTSPTVLSDSNIRESVIPALTTKASSLAPTSTNASVAPLNTDPAKTTSPDGSTVTDTSSNQYGVDSGDVDYGDIYAKVFGTENNSPTDSNTQQDISTLNALRTSQDASFANQMSTIASQYATNQQLLKDSQASENAKEDSFLLKSGAFRTSTGALAQGALVSGQINSLANLQTQENNAIAKVQSAQQSSDYKTMQQEMAVLDKVTADKKALAEKISTSLLAQNEKMASAKQQNSIDNAIATVVTSGVTDPSEILKEVTSQGLNVTAADITKSLNTISKGDIPGLTGNIKNFYSLKEAGALPSSISSLPDDKQLEAFLSSEKSTSSSVASNTKPLYTTPSGTSITKSDIEAGVQKLDDSKNGGQYADPKTYEAMYNYWEEQGLDPSQFIKNYPPKYYLDPSDQSVPSYLRPASAKATGITNPFANNTSTTTPA